jgi:hypothetical protein
VELKPFSGARQIVYCAANDNGGHVQHLERAQGDRESARRG